MEAYYLGMLTEVVHGLIASFEPIFLLQFVSLIFIFYGLKGLYLFSILRMSGRYHQPMSRIVEKKSKILIVGDSTAVGTGAHDIHNTIGGFLARDFPNTDIVNLGVNGSKTKAVLNQLARVQDTPFNMVIISTGGNDVWAFTRLHKLRTHFMSILREAKRMSNHHVIVLFFGNEGSAPFFPFFLRKLIMARTDSVQKILSEVANIEQVPLIELFSDPKENPFVRNPETYFAQDGLHPNDRGYWEWYKHLWRLMVNKNYLYHETVDIDVNL